MFDVRCSMFSFINKWLSFVRFSHTVFALPFALASMVVAARDQRGWPGWRTFGLILAAMLCARTCAMAFNRIVDREFDRENPRTANRHLPTGQISLASAWALCALSGLGLALAPIGAWLAVKDGFALWPLRESAILPLLLATAVVFWLIGFDIIYALQDYEFDRAHQLHSLVVRWGPKNDQ